MPLTRSRPVGCRNISTRTSSADPAPFCCRSRISTASPKRSRASSSARSPERHRAWGTRRCASPDDIASAAARRSRGVYRFRSRQRRQQDAIAPRRGSNLQTAGGSESIAMSRRIYFDGLNLSLERGTGIATYTRALAHVVRDLGHEIGVVYSSPTRPSKNPLLREIAFFDSREGPPPAALKEVWDAVCDLARAPLGVEPSGINLTGTVITEHFNGRLPLHDHMYVARNLFSNARRYFSWTGRFVDLAFDATPDILHCTYQMPLRVKRACNVYTIHDLV